MERPQTPIDERRLTAIMDGAQWSAGEMQLIVAELLIWRTIERELRRLGLHPLDMDCRVHRSSVQ